MLDHYNVLERPVANESDPLQLSFGLTLMQIIDVVSTLQFEFLRTAFSFAAIMASQKCAAMTTKRKLLCIFGNGMCLFLSTTAIVTIAKFRPERYNILFPIFAH